MFEGILFLYYLASSDVASATCPIGDIGGSYLASSDVASATCPIGGIGGVLILTGVLTLSSFLSE